MLTGANQKQSKLKNRMNALMIGFNKFLQLLSTENEEKLSQEKKWKLRINQHQDMSPETWSDKTGDAINNFKNYGN